MSTTATTRKAGIPIRDAGGLPPIKNYYEGVQWKPGERSWIFGNLQDARLDANAMTRKELQRKSLYFDKNNAFQNRLADIFEQYTVGTGLPVVSQSADATEYFKRWCKNSDSLGLQNFYGQQGMGARAWYVFGESFWVFEIIRGRLRLNVVESHRCETPPHLTSQEGKTVIDGKTIDANGCVTGYWFSTGDQSPFDTVTPEQWKWVRAEDVIHIYEPSRARMYRGLPFVSPVINDLNDLDDLQSLTMQVAKQAATIGNVTTNRTGEFDATQARRAAMKINSASAAGGSVTKNYGEFYTVKMGANEIALQHGDSISQFQANRPSLVEQQHWDYLTTKICAGVGISKLLVMPYSMQGTVARADLDIAAAFFRARSSVMQAAVEKVFMRVIEWAQDYDREVLRGGFSFDGYENVTVRPPRSVNVDVGRNSKALISELEACIRTPQEVYAEQGQDWRTAFDQIAEAKAYAAEKNITLPSLDLQKKTAGDALENENDELQTSK